MTVACRVVGAGPGGLGAATAKDSEVVPAGRRSLCVRHWDCPDIGATVGWADERSASVDEMTTPRKASDAVSVQSDPAQESSAVAVAWGTLG